MEITIREAIPDDAEQLVPFVQHLSEEPGLYIVMGPGEFTLTVEQERQVLADYAAADNCVFLVAEAGGQIIGSLNCKGGTRRVKRHEVVLGISVAREWRGQGVGKKLMARAIEWARGTGVVTRIELIVFARNEVARRLYESFGFAVEGCLRRAIYRDGEYFDDLVMGLLLRGAEMRISDCIACADFPCTDVRHDRYVVPEVDVDPAKVSIVLISEAAPAELADYYYAGGEALFQETTVLAFQDAGANVSSIQDILDLGVYLTTAVKCGKTGYGIATGTIRQCSRILEQELALFPHGQVFLLMGDVAIRAVNYIARRNKEPRVIPAGSTYKIRGGEFYFRGRRAFPSYLQAGPSFGIEKSKRQMIAQDIAAALALVR